MKLNIGSIYNEYTVIAGGKNTKAGRYYLCRCSCGTLKEIRASHLVSGKIKSCGCYNKELSKQRLKNNKLSETHGMSKSRLYRIWMAMRSRCGVIKGAQKNYGIRGIKVCDDWRNCFESFRNWAINNGYKDDLTIDRIDVNCDYCPKNCRWITNLEQQNNRRNNHIIVVDNKKYTLAEYSRLTGIPQSTLWGKSKRGYF